MAVAEMKDGFIKVENLSIQYGNTPILNDIHFECKQGEFVSIVGLSGSGKSSFLNALAGFIPFTGKVVMPRKFGYIFQNYSVFPWMNVAENISFGLENIPDHERRKKVDEILEKIGMKEHAEKYPDQLSGGQVQRVALARTFAPDPEVLLADEPYGALDHHTRDKMHEWLLNLLIENRKTVIFVTHYIEEAIFLSDRVIILRDKKFVANIDIPFPRPRRPEVRFDQAFFDLKLHILNEMEGKTIALINRQG